MRLGFISGKWPFTWGGSEILWGSAVQAAISEGHQVLVSVVGSTPEPLELNAFARSGVQVHRQWYVPHPTLQRRLNRWVFPFRGVSKFKPDVICLGQVGTDDFCSQYGPRTVKQLTSRWTIPYVVVCQYNDDGYVPSEAIRQIGREVYGRADRFVVISESNLRAYERQFATRLPNAQIIRNPVNLNNRTAPPWVTTEPLVLGYVGRLDARAKGLDLLIEALAGETWRTRPWRLRLVGDGPDRSYLEELTRLYGVEGRVSFLGRRDDVRAVWAECHICVSPSRAEGMPMALLEGMVCGRPAVATDCGAAREWVIEGRTGFLADGPTTKAISSALERAWLSRASWQELGAQAHAHTAPLIVADPGRTLLAALTEIAK